METIDHYANEVVQEIEILATLGLQVPPPKPDWIAVVKDCYDDIIPVSQCVDQLLLS